MKMEDCMKSAADGFGGRISLRPEDPFKKPRGFVGINVWRGSVGSVLEHSVMVPGTPLSENLVVTIARRLMSRMLSGAVADPTPTNPTVEFLDTTHPFYPEVTITAPSELFITKMRWGTGGHDPGNPTQAIDPDPADEHLYSPIPNPSYKSVEVDYPTNASVRFTASLEQSEANGLGISEVGLFTDQHEILFARKTFGILSKTSDFSFEFRYTIIF